MKRKLVLLGLLGLSLLTLVSCGKKKSSGCTSPTCPIGIRVEVPNVGLLSFFH